LNLGGASTGNVVIDSGNGLISLLDNTTLTGSTFIFNNALATITTGTDQNLTINPNGTGDLILSTDAETGVFIGTSANTPAPLSISGGIGSNASLIVNNTNSGDLLAASASGTTRFRVA